MSFVPRLRFLILFTGLACATLVAPRAHGDLISCTKAVFHWGYGEGQELIRTAKFHLKNRGTKMPNLNTPEFKRLVEQYEAALLAGRSIQPSEIKGPLEAAALMSASVKSMGWDVQEFSKRVRSLPKGERDRVARALNLAPAFWMKNGAPLTLEDSKNWVVTVAAALHEPKGLKGLIVDKELSAYYKDMFEAHLMESTVPETLSRMGIVQDPQTASKWKAFLQKDSKTARVFSRIIFGYQNVVNKRTGRAALQAFPDALIQRYIDSGGDFRVIEKDVVKLMGVKPHEVYRMKKQFSQVMWILMANWLASLYADARHDLAFEDPYPDEDKKEKEDPTKITDRLTKNRTEMLKILLESAKEEFKQTSGREPEIKGRDKAWWDETVKNYNELTDGALKLEVGAQQRE